MRIGILADIHDAVRPLEKALSIFQDRGIDQVVTLGDAFDSYVTSEPAAEVARLLQEARAVGVWGNHDFGLSYEVPEQARRDGDPFLLEFAAELGPQLVVGECRFSHNEPRLDPRDLADLWHFDDLDPASKAKRNFDATPERVLFMGHYHRWMIMRSDGRVEWDERQSLPLPAPDRYLVAISAVVRGQCAIFDTESCVLDPVECGV